MTVTLDLPEELVSRLKTSLPDGNHDRFAAAALADALDLRQRETEDCVLIVEQALADMDAGRGLVSLEEACRQWEADMAARRAAETRV